MDFLANTDVVSKVRWVILALLGVLVFLFIAWGLVTLTRSVFGGNDNPSTSTTSESADGDSDSDSALLGVRTARYTVDGPVVATQDHRSYTIEVSSNTVLMRVYSNYGQIVIDEKTYSNNDEAYINFVESLEHLNATARREGTSAADDFSEDGICPEGRRHVLELGDEIRRWFTSCKTLPGTSGSDMNAIRRLFIRQTPDFDDLVENTGLRLREDPPRKLTTN